MLKQLYARYRIVTDSSGPVLTYRRVEAIFILSTKGQDNGEYHLGGRVLVQGVTRDFRFTLVGGALLWLWASAMAARLVYERAAAQRSLAG